MPAGRCLGCLVTRRTRRLFGSETATTHCRLICFPSAPYAGHQPVRLRMCVYETRGIHGLQRRLRSLRCSCCSGREFKGACITTGKCQARTWIPRRRNNRNGVVDAYRSLRCLTEWRLHRCPQGALFDGKLLLRTETEASTTTTTKPLLAASFLADCSCYPRPSRGDRASRSARGDGEGKQAREAADDAFSSAGLPSECLVNQGSFLPPPPASHGRVVLTWNSPLPSQTRRDHG